MFVLFSDKALGSVLILHILYLSATCELVVITGFYYATFYKKRCQITRMSSLDKVLLLLSSTFVLFISNWKMNTISVF